MSTSIKCQTIYAFVDDVKREFYVWHTKNSDLKSVYEYHRQRRNACTKAMFDRGEGELPRAKMYVLSEVSLKEEVAFRHCIAWTRYFLDHGYRCLNWPTHIAYATHLSPDTQEIYDYFRDRRVEDVLSLRALRFADYGTHRRPNSQTAEVKKITFELLPEEYEKVKKQAARQGMTLKQFVKQRVLTGKTVSKRFDSIDALMGLSDQMKLIGRELDRLRYEQVMGLRDPGDIAPVTRLIEQTLAINREFMTRMAKELNKQA